ncbi:hypothetical protein A2715_03635 [Candidatus Woesebacteria bacterium RIFCSPHIGHO2_01_FULL_39_32]|uniref:DUF1761 domain-containing protein n=1 Tax=Candidatus Woesebacteria bacterium RIFCSPLOWO2_01_FULL_39_25 TaxID=1802521 RepID=A0A1F8BN03_9BACT|nr:MAG: hypothetical protein A2124_04940 [Candidatus Woesebacteria bacterium GWB1_37_5]OGM24832.1 MAG: hypothetical protein A2715_03635 [Candidatus Woesebacteria bacterium RIFCSPHIGHO2_01_FULL_39_32]OGM37153.1 MAG: hypothetical protein A3F01_05575 [Candidatus Woesebacteria bacterium RIFCSPHIGHO2_12_FULL_38_11]OGM64658.1 MAG: hypothetical protein A2893_06550 [Candidatus Woesebacteria bacterium RIFCSPLOWO2_01_FULL_39_25]
MNRKIVTTGILAGVAMLVVGIVLNWLWGVLFPSLAAEYQNPALFRPWSDPLMSYIFIHPFVVGIILAWVWDKTKHLFKERDVFWRCCQFAASYWLITIPGMLISYSSFQVSFVMILTWSIAILVQAIASGLVFVKKNP